MREVQARTLGKGAQLVGEGEEKWVVSPLFAYDKVRWRTARRACRRRKVNVNVTKREVMRSARDGIVGEMNIMIDGQVLEDVAVIKYLGSLVTAVGGVEADVQQRVLERSKVLGAVRSILKGRTMSWGVKKT